MNKTHKKLKEMKNSIIAANLPAMDIEKTKNELVDWLSQLKLPVGLAAENWTDCVKEYPDTSENDDSEDLDITSKLRFSLKLYTNQHNYLLSIIELVNQDSKYNGIVAVHVNLDDKESNILDALDVTYKHTSLNTFHAKQTLWVQSFDFSNLAEALNSCGMAILGNELIGEPVKENKSAVKNLHPIKANFPE